LSAAPLAIQDTKFTAGVRGTDGIAVLSSTEGRFVLSWPTVTR
jgi:hypothetical protein